MDAATADTLVGIAEEARARLRRQEPGAGVPVEERYSEMLQALDWYLDRGQPDVAFRLASALASFWIYTKRIDDGDQWFNRALSRGTGNDAAWARGVHDHGYLVFWAGRYELAEQRLAKSLAANLSMVERQLGFLGRAARLNGLAPARLERAGGEWPPDERQQDDETPSTIAAGLPPDVLKRCMAQGAAMSLPDGVAFALKSESGAGSGRCR